MTWREQQIRHVFPYRGPAPAGESLSPKTGARHRPTKKQNNSLPQARQHQGSHRHAQDSCVENQVCFYYFVWGLCEFCVFPNLVRISEAGAPTLEILHPPLSPFVCLVERANKPPSFLIENMQRPQTQEKKRQKKRWECHLGAVVVMVFNPTIILAMTLSSGATAY